MWWSIVKYRDSLPWAVQKQLNWSRCCLGRGLWCVLDGGAHWCHLASTIEPSVCGGDAAFLSNYFDHLFGFFVTMHMLSWDLPSCWRHHTSSVTLSTWLPLILPWHKWRELGTLWVQVALSAFTADVLYTAAHCQCEYKIWCMRGFVWNVGIYFRLHRYLSYGLSLVFGSRPSDHYFRSVLVCLSVCLFVCLCRVFLSRLWSDFDQTRPYVICLGLVVSAGI